MRSLRIIRVVLLMSVLIFPGVVITNNVVLAQGTKIFNNPTIKGYRLDWCLHWGKQCGKPAADAWCSTKMGKAGGYAIGWKQAVNIGASSPTYVMGDGRVCNQWFCDSFQWIKCGFSLD